MPSQSPSSGPPANLPSRFIAEHDVIWFGISLWSVGGQLSRLCPPRLLVHPQPARWWGGVRSRKGVDSVQALLSSNENIPELSTPFPAPIRNTAPCQLLRRKLTLSQPKPGRTTQPGYGNRPQPGHKPNADTGIQKCSATQRRAALSLNTKARGRGR